MRLLISIPFLMLLVTLSQAAEKQIGQNEQIEQRLKIQEERLVNIEEQVSLKYQQIEDWYSRSLTDLRQLALRKAKQIKLSDRALWVEYAKMSEQTPQFDTYFKMNNYIPNAYGYFMNTTTIFLRDVETYKLRDAFSESFFLSSTADLLLDTGFRKCLIDLANGSAYNPQSLSIRREARKLLHLANEFASKLTNLNNRKKVKLNALEQWEKYLRADVLRVMSEIQAEPEKINGIVSAIIYNEKTPLCMINGSDKIFKPGDRAGSITIRNIYTDRVEFTKDGQRWTQEIGEPANAAWL